MGFFVFDSRQIRKTPELRVCCEQIILVEHLLTRGEDLQEFADSGCLFIISAVESLSERVLKILDKCHSRADVEAAVGLCRDVGITIRPTWVAFTPWTTLDDYILPSISRFIDA